MIFVDKFGTKFSCDFNFESCNTLVLSGGALKCIYLLGALARIKKKFKIYIGTSCGAIIGTLLAVGYTPFEIFREILKHNDYTITTALEHAVERMKIMFIKKGFNPDISFEDFERKTGCKMGFISTNMTKFREEFLICRYHAKTPILTAVRLSSALPIVFPKEKYNDQLFIDGLFFDNFPVKLTLEISGVESVVAITTFNSKYENKIKTFYTQPEKYKFIYIPAPSGWVFRLSTEEKFKMFMKGYCFVDENIQICNSPNVLRNLRRKSF